MDFLKGKYLSIPVGAVSAETSVNAHWARASDIDALSSIRSITRSAHSPTRSTNSRNSLSFLSANNARRTLRTLFRSSTEPQLTPGSPTALAPMEPHHDVDQTRDSAISGLSILEDDTDEFYHKTLAKLNHDRERFKNATTGQPMQAFRRAKTTPSSINIFGDATLRDSRRVPSPALSERTNSTGDGSPVRRQDRSPTTNIPKQWGRKGVQRNDYLHRINSTGDLQESKGDSEQPDPDRIFRRRTLYTGDSPNEPDPDQPIPSTESGSPSSARKRRLSRLTWRSSSRGYRAVDDIIEREKRVAADAQGEQDDGSGKSRLRKRSVPELQQQTEIDSIKTRAVTTSRLAEAAKRSNMAGKSLADAYRSLGEEPGPEQYVHSDRLANGDDETDMFVSAKHSRQDSRDLLKQLARVSSLSPSPGKTRPVQVASNERAHSSPQLPRAPMRSSSLKQTTGLHHSKSASGDLQQKTQSHDVARLQTPKVTGAWIETPKVQPSAISDFDEAAVDDGRSQPRTSRHPRSALEGVLQQASKARTSRDAGKAQNTSRVQQNGDDGAELTIGSSEELGDETFIDLQNMALDDTTELDGFDPEIKAAIVKASIPRDDPSSDNNPSDVSAKLDESSARPSVPLTPTTSPRPQKPKSSKHTRIPSDTSKALPAVPPTKSATAAIANSSKTPKASSLPMNNEDPDPKETAIQQAIHLENLAIQYFDPKLRNLPTDKRMDRIFLAASNHDKSLELIRQYAAQLQQQQQHLSPQPCPHSSDQHSALPSPHQHQNPTEHPTLSILLRNTASSLHSHLTYRTFYSPDLHRPTPAGYALLAFLLWLSTEEALCTRYCHPAATDYFPPFRWLDPLAYLEHPVKPYVAYTVLLREPFWFLFKPLEFLLGWTVVVPLLVLDWLLGGVFVRWWFQGYVDRFGGFVLGRPWE